MAEYLAHQIEIGNLKYSEVIEKFPHYKDDIDSTLKDRGSYESIDKN